VKQKTVKKFKQSAVESPLGKREAVKKVEEVPSELHKSPLTPLFQRGELGL
jgi:hypothetical protein